MSSLPSQSASESPSASPSLCPKSNVKNKDEKIIHGPSASSSTALEPERNTRPVQKPKYNTSTIPEPKYNTSTIPEPKCNTSTSSKPVESKSISEMVGKAKRAAASLWMILHAQNCCLSNSPNTNPSYMHRPTCPYLGCDETKLLLLHVKTCRSSHQEECPTGYNGCRQARTLLHHYKTCREIRQYQLQSRHSRTSPNACLVCSLVARHARNVLEGGRAPVPMICTPATSSSSAANITVSSQGASLTRPSAMQIMPPPPPRIGKPSTSGSITGNASNANPPAAEQGYGTPPTISQLMHRDMVAMANIAAVNDNGKSASVTTTKDATIKKERRFHPYHNKTSPKRTYQSPNNDIRRRRALSVGSECSSTSSCSESFTSHSSKVHTSSSFPPSEEDQFSGRNDPTVELTLSTTSTGEEEAVQVEQEELKQGSDSDESSCAPNAEPENEHIIPGIRRRSASCGVLTTLLRPIVEESTGGNSPASSHAIDRE